MLIESIINREFSLARSIYIQGDKINLDKDIIQAAYSSEDTVYCDFYEYMIRQDLYNASLHYALAELYALVFNFLPDGYEMAFYHIKKCIELAPSDVSYKEFMLLFHNIPKPLLSKQEALNYAYQVISIIPESNTAWAIITSYSSR